MVWLSVDKEHPDILLGVVGKSEGKKFIGNESNRHLPSCLRIVFSQPNCRMRKIFSFQNSRGDKSWVLQVWLSNLGATYSVWLHQSHTRHLLVWIDSEMEAFDPQFTEILCCAMSVKGTQHIHNDQTCWFKPKQKRRGELPVRALSARASLPVSFWAYISHYSTAQASYPKHILRDLPNRLSQLPPVVANMQIVFVYELSAVTPIQQR